ncbi:MAG: leucine-rich repeat domain-containing protein [bacterium]|nr:leucine-rich repeat domain-containing protein [bacterium]
MEETGVDATLRIPEGTTEIAQRQFMNNAAVKHVHAPRSLRIIYPQAFENCPNLTTFVMEEGELERVGGWAFSNNPSLEMVVLPNVRDININAFEKCPKLESVIIGERIFVLLG